MKTLLEVREYNFEDGTRLLIQLDRRAKKASFVDHTRNGAKEEYVPMNFKFAGRELGYMNGWLNILSAMKYVIEDIKKEMEAWDDETADDLVKTLIAIEQIGKTKKKK